MCSYFYPVNNCRISAYPAVVTYNNTARLTRLVCHWTIYLDSMIKTENRYPTADHNVRTKTDDTRKMRITANTTIIARIQLMPYNRTSAYEGFITKVHHFRVYFRILGNKTISEKLRACVLPKNML
ncbi:hypothetical protein NCH01_18830 [Neoasaia chiangmaiensis]|uniref:Uncharacterized protein n=1 Tax=Neoasaia chiangmaiensis TaxID=320497 RepID=A0A1U9KRY5_9PROT|nr:hypothetical protein A0U93_12390 [Neoasaia chiangmaiensis]GEN15452.1 hypothetical protein NCH01_18830 [Neoasaia chiangmaiensis]